MTYMRMFYILCPPFDIIHLWIGLCRADFFNSHSNLRQVADKSDIYDQLNMTVSPYYTINYNIVLISFLFGGFLKAKFFLSHSNERQGPEKPDIYNHLINGM